MEIKAQIFSVSEINAVIKDVLEEAFPEVWVKGEISNLKNYSNHLFFTLKDEKSQLRAVLFRGHHSKLRFSPRDGMSVLVRGTLSLYETRGEFQFIANYMEPLGVGTLRLAFEELKKKLADKGYFDEGRKRPLPELPRTIGVITSPKGAVIRDILNILKRRFYNMHIIIFPVKVQGEGAREEIAEAIHYANRHLKNIEVIILARGGGSLEDLWAFNEEVVADAIFNSAIPVISAVGHETDFTIADFVADLRAPTPSAAAELVVRKKDDLEEVLHQLYQRIKTMTMRQYALLRGRLASEQRILRSPLPRIRQNVLLVSDLQDRLQSALVNTVAGLRRDIAAMGQTLHLASPSRKLGLIRTRLDALDANIIKTARYGLSCRKNAYVSLAGKLETLSPLKILSRGYSIALTVPGQKVLKDSKQVSKGDAINVRLSKGSIRCTVDDREESS